VKVKQSLYRLITGPEVSRMKILADFETNAHAVGKAISPTHRPPSPQELFHVCYRPSPLQSHSAAGRIMSNEKFE